MWAHTNPRTRRRLGDPARTMCRPSHTAGSEPAGPCATIVAAPGRGLTRYESYESYHTMGATRARVGVAVHQPAQGKRDERQRLSRPWPGVAHADRALTHLGNTQHEPRPLHPLRRPSVARARRPVVPAPPPAPRAAQQAQPARVRVAKRAGLRHDRRAARRGRVVGRDRGRDPPRRRGPCRAARRHRRGAAGAHARPAAGAEAHPGPAEPE